MRSPTLILDNLANKSNDYVYKRIYRNFYNKQFYYLAYGKEDVEKIEVEHIIRMMKDKTYQPSKINSIDKRSEKYQVDILVSDVLVLLLQAMYRFSDHSHGYQDGKSPHTALKHVEGTFRGVKWFVQAKLDVHTDHHTLINILRKRINDEHFIDLIWKFINAGYLSDWVFGKTYSKLATGNQLNQCLLNIYYHELDQYISSYKEKFDIGKMRKVNLAYKRLQSQLYKRRKKYKENWEDMTEAEKNEARAYVKETRKELQSMTYKDPMDASYKRLQFVRCGTEVLIGVIGSKVDAKEIEADIKEYLNNTLHVQEIKISTQHSKKRLRYLGYDIIVLRNNDRIKKTKSGTTQRTLSMVCQLLLPHDVWRNQLVSYKVIRIDSHRNKWKSVHRSHLVHADDLEILRTYNMEIVSLYNYYALANDSSNLERFKHFMQYSMYKTYAYKYKSNVPKIIKRFKHNGRFTVTYRFGDNRQTATFYDKGFKRKRSLPENHELVDFLPNTHKFHSSKNSMMNRLENRVCQDCMSQSNIEQHHKNRLNNIQKKKVWDRKVMERQRETIPLCRECHRPLHKSY